MILQHILLNEVHSHILGDVQFEGILSIKIRQTGSGFSTVDSVVACNTREPGFESCHQQLLLNNYFLLTVCRENETKEKEAGNAPLKWQTTENGRRGDLGGNKTRLKWF